LNCRLDGGIILFRIEAWGGGHATVIGLAISQDGDVRTHLALQSFHSILNIHRCIFAAHRRLKFFGELPVEIDPFIDKALTCVCKRMGLGFGEKSITFGQVLFPGWRGGNWAYRACQIGDLGLKSIDPGIQTRNLATKPLEVRL